jgi:hypothetical protein
LGEVWAGDFEGFVHFVDEQAEFATGEVTVLVEFFEFGGGGLGGSVAVFADVHDLAGDA